MLIHTQRPDHLLDMMLLDIFEQVLPDVYVRDCLARDLDAGSIALRQIIEKPRPNRERLIAVDGLTPVMVDGIVNVCRKLVAGGLPHQNGHPETQSEDDRMPAENNRI